MANFHVFAFLDKFRRVCENEAFDSKFHAGFDADPFLCFVRIHHFSVSRSMFSRLLICVLALSSFSSLGANEPGASADERKKMIRELVNKLGDEDFVVRQQSEALLFQIGIAAFADLEEAKVGPDPEIAARAEFLLSRLETVYRGPRDYAAEHYSKAEIPFQKASYLRLFAHPKEYPGGLGLAFLIHLARFEKDRPLQIEAIKALIASPPESLDNGRVWYRHIAETFAEPGPTEPLRLLSDYAKLRCEFDELSETAWNGALRNARESATMLEIPTLPITDALRGRTLDLLQRMKAFQEDPEFSVFKKGHWIDILFFYAMAEMLDVIGETEARDRIVAEAVAVQSAPYPADHSLLIAIVNEERKNFDHYTVGLALKWRYRLAWSLNHLRITIDEGDALLRVLAGADLAECYRLMND